MKTLSSLLATTFLLFGNCFADGDHAAQEEPAFFSITSSALDHLKLLHEVESEYRTKTVSLVLRDNLTAPTSNFSGYSIKLEHLYFQKEETPGTIPIVIHGLECRATPTLIARLKKSTIEFVYVVSTDGAHVPQVTALVLRPTDPIIVKPYERKR
jgi:hypothetical protein